MTDGVTVAQKFLVLLVEVRILVGQQVLIFSGLFYFTKKQQTIQFDF